MRTPCCNGRSMRGWRALAWEPPRFPKQLWVVDEDGQVFEAMYGGSREGAYHGYPIRKTDPFFDEVHRTWKRRLDV